MPGRCRGRSPAAMRPGAAPQRCIAASVASSTPATAPRQPAWAAPMTPARIGEQHRRAIAGHDAQRDAAAVGHHRVGARAVPRGPRLGHMGRHRCHAPGGIPTSPAGSAPIARAARARFSNTLSRGSVPGQAAVEARERAGGHAAAAGEEAVRRRRSVARAGIQQPGHATAFGRSGRSVYRRAPQYESHAGDGVCKHLADWTAVAYAAVSCRRCGRQMGSNRRWTARRRREHASRLSAPGFCALGPCALETCALEPCLPGPLAPVASGPPPGFG